MEYKPWPLLILAFLHFIEPVSKTLLYSIYFHVNPLDAVVIEYQTGSALHAFEFFLLFPIAGLALFAVKKWSFSIFLAVELWVFITNIPYFEELYLTNQQWLLGYFILFGILNITVVCYLLLPAVRIAYLDPRIRWWEAKPRYSTNIECKVDSNGIGIIKNISGSGIFITTHNDFLIDSDVDLDFILTVPSTQFEEFHIQSKASVMHKFFVDDIEGYGARFTGLTENNKELINSMIKCLENSTVDRRPPRRSFNELVMWFTTLIKTGKGLIPQCHLYTARKAR